MKVYSFSNTVTSSSHDANGMKEQIITKKKGLVEGQRSEVTDQRLSKSLKVDGDINQRLKTRGQKSEFGSEVG